MIRLKKTSRLGKGFVILSSFLVACTITSATLQKYQIPTTNKNLPVTNPTLEALSQGSIELTRYAKKGLVFISVSKKTQMSAPRNIDPFFEFFFRGQRPDIQEKDMPKQKAFGSGFFIDLTKGYIITNNHVIDEADSIEVKLANDKSYDAEVVGKDAKTDIAVLKIKDIKFDRSELNALVLDDSDKIESGSMVWAFGAPFHLQASVSQGIISATGRGSLSNDGMNDFIQTDAAINPGNSGGPLINAKHRVVGVNTAIFRTASGVYNGVSFAIPAHIVRRVASSLINDGKMSRGFIGVRFQAMPPEWSKTLKLPKNLRGYIVSDVTKDGPADKAGVRSGDVIYQIGDKKFENTSDLASTVGLMKPGEKTTLKLFRNGKDLTVTLEIGFWPEEDKKEEKKSETKKKDTSHNDFGLATKPLTDFDNDFIAKNKIKSKHGLVITDVKEDSKAAKVGLRDNDVIVSVNLRQDVVSSSSKLDNFISSASSGSSLIFGIERDGQVRYVEMSK